MIIDGKTIWQIGAGDVKRNYAKYCLENGVIMIGPGQYGAWPECAALIRSKEPVTRPGIIGCFAEKMRKGDLVVLKRGTQRVYGVGEVAGDYDWSEEFANVQGWNLHHFRRVKWLWHQNGEPEILPKYSFAIGTLSHLRSPVVRNWLESLQI